RSWGQVISWNLGTSYAAHAPAFAEALGVSLPAAAAALALAAVALFAGAWLYLRRFDWAPALSRAWSTGFLVIVLAAGWTVCGIQLCKFVAWPPVAHAEPVSLTMFPSQTARGMHTIAGSDSRG